LEAESDVLECSERKYCVEQRVVVRFRTVSIFRTLHPQFSPSDMASIDFSRIRGDTAEAQARFFEQLVCLLARLERQDGEFRRIEGVGGDGGVEAVRILPGGSEIGYQAKFFPSAGKIGWRQVDESVKTALTWHPRLTRYIVAFPCDFTGRRAARNGSTEGVWGTWDQQVERWRQMAAERGMSVEFEPWTAFTLETALHRPEAQHLVPFFFERTLFTREWMQRELERTRHDLRARYSPGEHVDTESLEAFDIIYHRESVRERLRAVFDTARTSEPLAAANLAPGLFDGMAERAERLRTAFVSLAEAVEWDAGHPWPVCEWVTQWTEFTRSLGDFHQLIASEVANDGREGEITRDRVAALTRIYDLTGPEIFAGPLYYTLPIDGARAALFVGRAGAGKSHVLARGAETAFAAGAPVVHLLGQHILSDDPRESILNRLGLANWSFREALVALNLAAEIAGTPALLVIDALNEGRGAETWLRELPGLVREVNQHDRIVLVVSCREEYLNYVVPSELIAKPRPYPDEVGEPPQDCSPHGKLVEVRVSGFSRYSEREAALRTFMDEKGIARPTAPVLDEEFFNPLFITSVCRAMASAGVKVFPRGLHGAREIFNFVLETKAKALGTRYDGTLRVLPALRDALFGLAEMMVARIADHVPLDHALTRIGDAFKALPLSEQSWLEVLEGSDILRRDVEAKPHVGVWARPSEVVRFSFQRLQDNLMAEHLVERCRAAGINDAFAEGGPLAFLVRRYTESEKQYVGFSRGWVGLAGAVWAAVAESFGKELWDLPSFAGEGEVYVYHAEVRPVFLASVREREAGAFTPRTRQLLNHFWKDAQPQKLAILLSMSCVPGHAWNARTVSKALLSLTPDQRALRWAQPFDGDVQSDLYKRSMEIAEWALSAEVELADREVVQLAGITLAFLRIVHNPEVRQRATEGLERLLKNALYLLPHLEEEFRDVSDSEMRSFHSGAQREGPSSAAS
jgi:hypothetical protein